MLKKRCFAFFFLFIFAVSLMGLTTGCNQEDKEFLQLFKSVGKLRVTEKSGQLSLRLHSIPQQTATTDADTVAMNTLLQNGLTFKYTTKQDLNQNKLACSLFYINPKTNSSEKLLEILSQNNFLYVRIDGVLDFLQKINPGKFTSFRELFGNTQYLRLTKNEYLQILDSASLPIIQNNAIVLGMLQTNNFVDAGTNQILERFLFGLAETYEGHQLNLVTKNGDKGYTLTLNGRELLKLLPSSLIYSLENFETIEAFLFSFLNGLTRNELTALELSAQEKEQYKIILQTTKTLLQQDKEAALRELNALCAEMQTKHDAFKDLKNFNLTYVIGKENNDLYTHSYKLHIDPTVGDSTINKEHAGFTMENQSTLRPISAFPIDLPTAKIMDFSELQKLFTKTLAIAIDRNTCLIKTKDGEKTEQIKPRIIADFTYLPLRKVATIFGEGVFWDASQNKAYIIRGAQKIQMTGTIVENHTYVKIRDFTKLGYQIDWDENTKTAKLTKIF